MTLFSKLLGSTPNRGSFGSLHSPRLRPWAYRAQGARKSSDTSGPGCVLFLLIAGGRTGAASPTPCSAHPHPRGTS